MKSLNFQVLIDLMKGGTITKLEAIKVYKTTSLNSRISDIRNKMGIPVSDVWINIPQKKDKPKRVKRYFMTKQDVKFAKKKLGKSFPILDSK